MPLESVTYISDLVTTNPDHNDSIGVVDSHVRNIKSALKTTFPNVTGPVAVNQAQLNGIWNATDRLSALEAASNRLTGDQFLTGNLALSAGKAVNASVIQENGRQLLPYGMIVMWSGAVAAIPSGWHLCDGTAGTPDLRDRFIIGAGYSYSPGATGGAAAVSGTTAVGGAHSHNGLTETSGSHTHTSWTDVQGGHDHGGSVRGHALAVDEIPPHAHNYTVLTGGINTGGLGGLIAGVSASNGNSTTSYTGSGWEHHHSIGGDGAHGHNVGVSTDGGHQHSIDWDGGHAHAISFDIRPPYVALCFIMKIL